MEAATESTPDLGQTTKRISRRLLVIAENRLQLLKLEVEEEREHILVSIWLALGLAVFGLLAGVALTVLIAVAFWEHSPILALLALLVVYTLAAVGCYWRLVQLQKNWQTLPATLEQLKKDRECLEQLL